MMVLVSSFYEHTLVGQLLGGPVYKDGIRSAVDGHMRAAVWRISPEQFQGLQARATKYMETRGFRNATSRSG